MSNQEAISVGIVCNLSILMSEREINLPSGLWCKAFDNSLTEYLRLIPYVDREVENKVPIVRNEVETIRDPRAHGSNEQLALFSL